MSGVMIVSDQVVPLVDLPTQLKLEHSTCCSVFWSSQRMENYFAWNEEKADRIMVNLYQRAKRWTERFPNDKNVYKHVLKHLPKWRKDVLSALQWQREHH
ncbi:hypothetical protein [Vibrio sp. TBV020]|uniref:hypothetical protein n=1 Tax=Vibrio sp. TBV020 TaxID=3137398 RepID=UPI0038CD61C0